MHIIWVGGGEVRGAGGVALVINYDMPSTVEAYTHRCERGFGFEFGFEFIYGVFEFGFGVDRAVVRLSCGVLNGWSADSIGWRRPAAAAAFVETAHG